MIGRLGGICLEGNVDFFGYFLNYIVYDSYYFWLW